MALIINKVKKFKWTVDYEYPVDDDFVEVKFKAVCEKVIVGWEDVFMEDDKGTEVEVPFNKENLKNLLEIPFLSLYLVKSFYEGQTGKKLKNLEGQSTIS